MSPTDPKPIPYLFLSLFFSCVDFPYLSNLFLSETRLGMVFPFQARSAIPTHGILCIIPSIPQCEMEGVATWGVVARVPNKKTRRESAVLQNKCHPMGEHVSP
jgi:hypothetical protein